MTIWIILGLIATALVSIIISQNIKYSWLIQTVRLLILSLPFERIPNVTLGGSNFRLSQLFTLLATYFLLILIVKRDPQTLQHKLSKYSYLWLLFFAVTIPSWLSIIELNRFLVTLLGSVLVFLACFLVATFAKDVFARGRELTYILFFTALFGVYQFVGDLAGVPYYLTGLREQYTKIVFGFPRIQGTAIEPLYFAGMLFMPIFFLGSAIATRFNQLLNKTTSRQDQVSTQPDVTQKHSDSRAFPIFNIFQLLIILAVFFLTLSKGAWLSLAVALALLVILYFKAIFGFITKLFKQYTKQTFALLGLLLLTLGVLYNTIPAINNFANTVTTHFVDTLVGETGTAVERSNFINDAISLLQEKPFFGIGSGHYGVLTDKIGRGTGEGYLIVNNVYLEVWLEQGFLGLLVFLAIILLPIGKGLMLLFDSNIDTKNKSLLIGLIFGLISYYIQWFTFSPIFIMPIFILLGLLIALIKNLETVQ